MKQPSAKELELKRQGERGLITDTDIAKALGMKQRQAAACRMWRVHKWTIAQRSYKRTKR